jgi:hypothetical protein
MQNQKKTSKSLKKTVSLKTYLLSILMVCAVAIGGVWYVRTSSRDSGVYPGAPSYTIWTDGAGNYFAKDAYGNLAFSGTNASYVIQSAIYALPHVLVSLPFGNYPVVSAPNGKIQFTAQQFNISNYLIIPLGSRITLCGCGITYQSFGTGKQGGTQIISSDPRGCLVAADYGTYVNGTSVTKVSGSELEIESIEFYQRTTLANASASAVYLSGASQGILDNVVITSYRQWGNITSGYGLNINNYDCGGCWRWSRLQIEGFANSIQDYSDVLEADQLELSYAYQALTIWVTPYKHYQAVHFGYVENCLTVAGGNDDLEMDCVYVESYRCNNKYYAWWANSSLFTGLVIINQLEVNVLQGSPSSKIWSVYNSQCFMFENVVTRDGIPNFPNPTTPVLASGTQYANTFSQLVEVNIFGGTVTAIVVRGITTNITSGSFLLYPGNTIEVTYSSAPSWCWLGLANALKTP